MFLVSPISRTRNWKPSDAAPCSASCLLPTNALCADFMQHLSSFDMIGAFHQDFTDASLPSFPCLPTSWRFKAGQSGGGDSAYWPTRQKPQNSRTKKPTITLRLAHVCKAAAESRNNIWKAERILQRAWRAYVKWRKEHMVASIKPQPWTMDMDSIEATETRLDIGLLWLSFISVVRFEKSKLYSRQMRGLFVFHVRHSKII